MFFDDYPPNVFVQFLYASCMMMSPSIVPGESVRDSADRCLRGNYSQLGGICAAVKHSDNVGLSSKMRPTPAKTFRSLRDLVALLG